MKKFLTIPAAILTFAAMLLFTGCGDESSDTGTKSNGDQVSASKVAENSSGKRGSKFTPKEVSGNLTVKMLNVGQGDSILIQTDSQNILIDTSDVDERDKLENELHKAKIKTIDQLILTHPHADHIGGAEILLDGKHGFEVKKVYDNGMPSTSSFYVNKKGTGYMNLIEANDIDYESLDSSHAPLDFGNGAQFEILYPTPELVADGSEKGYKHDPNNESVVGRLTFGGFSMMFTGDAESKTERAIVAINSALKSNVLKSGHHGSKTASSKEFLNAVKPEYVLISAGEPDVDRANTYGHPHREALNRYINAGLSRENILWTWENGTITITSDGKSFSVKTEKKSSNWIDDRLKK